MYLLLLIVAERLVSTTGPPWRKPEHSKFSRQWRHRGCANTWQSPLGGGNSPPLPLQSSSIPHPAAVLWWLHRMLGRKCWGVRRKLVGCWLPFCVVLFFAPYIVEAKFKIIKKKFKRRINVITTNFF